jgi:hypothetical protein
VQQHYVCSGGSVSPRLSRSPWRHDRSLLGSAPRVIVSEIE